ncbi:FtsW/RodA/SpoVE family cell cycle protein [Paenibacillus mendelii]|uniref:FtsW/RodA/SpoVE family cell cycle protein n=1 Tax=Paenibacillus mendelii TaxID=206163 RepID=A0ABV6JE01_9BACL|nr:FtsW/RodA/SpoVE family cell cycle protein [Paenibacillus mendelii]MCQ6563401.1 FtsW/RodA/SpoVE family cell cycle protein [Paenibacillus mendelii]
MIQSMERYPAVIAYLDRVCAQVKAKEVHEGIRLEMLSHLEELAVEKAAQGETTEEEAIAEALRHMGDPEQVGKQLHAAHKPKPEWSVIALVAGMIIIGLVSLYALQLSLNGNLLLGRKLVFGFTGVVAMIVLYFIDYRRLLRFSWPLYGATLLLMAAAQFQGVQKYGVVQWISVGSFGFNVYAASPYLLIIAIAGILQREKPVAKSIRQKAQSLAKDAAFYMLIPAFFYVTAPALVYFVIYGFGLAILLLVAGRRKLLFGGFGVLALMLSPLLSSRSFDYLWQRYIAFLNPEESANTGGFYTIHSVEAIRSGGLWGQGFGIANDRLPFVTSDLIYSYMVYSLGWVFGIAVATITLLFIVRIARMGIKLQDSYAKGMIVGLTAILGFQLVWNLLMCVGLLPINGMTLPIMNWNSGTIIELAAVGLMLGAYRRKNMLGSHHGSQAAKV